MWILTIALAVAPTLVVPFVSQRKDTCGAASLAMVSAYWGHPLPHDEIARELLESERGIAGSRLAHFARERGLTAVAYEGDLTQLREYVLKGRPMIVAWRMGSGRYHDVVVIGFDATGLHVIVNDPARGAGRTITVEVFEKRWAGAGHWTLLVMPGPR
jgi:ABC-type bacteriocin/lantibiotic exporter with double-glycine peptidase domain